MSLHISLILVSDIFLFGFRKIFLLSDRISVTLKETHCALIDSFIRPTHAVSANQLARKTGYYKQLMFWIINK